MPRLRPRRPIFDPDQIRGSIAVGNTPFTRPLIVADAVSASTIDNITLSPVLTLLLDELQAKSALGIWRMNDASGGFVDYSTSARNASSVGVSFQAVAGLDGFDYPDFDGTNDYGHLADDNDWTLDSSRAFFILAKLDSHDALGRTLMSKHIGANGFEWDISVLNTGRVYLSGYNTNASQVVRQLASPTSSFTTGTWHAIGIVTDSAMSNSMSGDINIDGSWLTTTITGTGTGYANGGAQMQIGGRNDSIVARWDGSLAYASMLPSGTTMADMDDIMTAAQAEGWF